VLLGTEVVPSKGERRIGRRPDEGEINDSLNTSSRSRIDGCLVLIDPIGSLTSRHKEER
jgi:hypothetical protein